MKKIIILCLETHVLVSTVLIGVAGLAIGRKMYRLGVEDGMKFKRFKDDFEEYLKSKEHKEKES